MEVRGLIDLLFDLLNGKIKIRWGDCEELVFLHITLERVKYAGIEKTASWVWKFSGNSEAFLGYLLAGFLTA